MSQTALFIENNDVDNEENANNDVDIMQKNYFKNPLTAQMHLNLSVFMTNSNNYR